MTTILCKKVLLIFDFFHSKQTPKCTFLHAPPNFRSANISTAKSNQLELLPPNFAFPRKGGIKEKGKTSDTVRREELFVNLVSLIRFGNETLFCKHFPRWITG